MPLLGIMGRFWDEHLAFFSEELVNRAAKKNKRLDS
jgi:hypothetical protein